MNVREVATSSLMTRSKLPDADYVINPYVGCPHGCIYCYAEYMKRFTGHAGEDWGTFVDVKRCEKKVDVTSIPPTATILIGSVTDAYNPLERKYGNTRHIIEQLKDCEARVEILTKSDLVLRDVDLFKAFRKLYIGVSLNTIDDGFRKQTEPFASSVKRRIDALRGLHDEGIHTYLFVSPIFPGISQCECVIDAVSPFVDYVCFENLNLRGSYLPRVMDYIRKEHPDLESLYKSIYWDKDMSYWKELETHLRDYCTQNSIEYRCYFYHDQITKR